jgi:DNA-binding response OmpR family regulator
MGVNVVVLETDPGTAQSLAGRLLSHFHAVHMTRSGDELRKRVAEERPQIIVVDVEYSRLTDVRRLHHDFPLLPIVCAHRIPDEQLWIEAMEAGATDVCRSEDVQDAVTSVLRKANLAHTASA